MHSSQDSKAGGRVESNFGKMCKKLITTFASGGREGKLWPERCARGPVTRRLLADVSFSEPCQWIAI